MAMVLMKAYTSKKDTDRSVKGKFLGEEHYVKKREKEHTEAIKVAGDTK